MKFDLDSISRKFEIHGTFVQAAPYGTGHINDTFSVVFCQAGKEVRYIFQRINHMIFKDPVNLMDNVVRVTDHIRKKLKKAGATNISRRVLTLLQTQQGGWYHQDDDGNYWRAYFFVEGAKTYDVLETLDQAYEAAKAFGQFQCYLADLPEPALIETIPDFHNAQKRYKTFLDVLEKDPCNRAASVKTEIDFLNSNSGLFDVLPKLVQAGQIPIRTTHNDTKINNVMIDDKTNEGICVIDLDTVMPGLSLYDFGDIVRTTASSSEEDEADTSKINAEAARFEAVVKGYLTGAGDFLNQAEVDHMLHGGKLITQVIGTRFLTDYLDGDNYFKIHREGHNLDRCRSQFKLVQSLTDQEEKLDSLVHECYRQIVKG